MSERTYSQVNTGISVREASFLSPSQFEQLLASDSSESREVLLQGTPYALDGQEIKDPEAIESRLMAALLVEYQWAFEATPQSDLVSLFTLKYTYHNLKVYLKNKATERTLGHLLIPIGPYSLDVLEHLVATFSAEYCPNFMAEEVAATWQEYQDYQDLRVLEIGMDLAYFKHLKILGESLDHPILKQLVDVTIDFYNAITVKRALDQQKPHSFMHQLLSDEGSLSAHQVIDLLESGQWLTWFYQVNPLDYDLALDTYEEKMRTGQLKTVELEYLESLVKFSLLDAGRFEVDGPLPLVRYLYGKELEVTNLRLVLSGLDNGFPPADIKERMRPIYGQTDL